MAERNKWFPYLNKKEDTKYRAFCFYHAGGNAEVYRKWLANQEIEFIPVELPGRGRRSEEAFITDINILVDLIAKEISELEDVRPFYLFGHSLGALIAFQTEYQLEQKHGIFGDGIIVAGRHAPNVIFNEVFKCSMGREFLVEELTRLNAMPRALLESKEYMEFYLPIIFNDYLLHESHRYNGELIKAPIIAHYGIRDTEANHHNMEQWRKVTHGFFNIEGFPGDHFFVLNKGDAYIKRIINEISNYVA